MRPAAFAAWLLVAPLLVAAADGSRGPAARAAAGGPATAPATRPVADPSTPKGALKALLAAAQAGDAKAVAAAFHVEKEINRPIVEAAAGSLCAHQRLLDAGAARFNVKRPPKPEATVPGLPSDLDAAPVRLDGTDKASVGDQKWSIVQMRRRDGVWKIAFEDTAGGFSPGQEEQAIREALKLRSLTRSLNRLADDVRKGKHQTPEAVQKELERLRKEADDAAAHSATQPSA